MDSFEWVDRIPANVGRVLITPESGGTPYYATVTRADNPEVIGTPVDAEHLNALVQKAGDTMTGDLIARIPGITETDTALRVINEETKEGSLSGTLKTARWFTNVI